MSEKFSTEWIAEQRELIEGAEELPYVVDDTVIGVPLDDCATRIVADVRKGNNRKYLLAAGNNYPDLLDEIERLQARVTELEAALESLRIHHHDDCEDPWYSCSKHPDYIGNDNSGICTCGMDRQNAIIDAALKGGEK